MSAVRVPRRFLFGSFWDAVDVVDLCWLCFSLRPFSPPLALFASKRRKRTPWHTTLNILTANGTLTSSHPANLNVLPRLAAFISASKDIHQTERHWDYGLVPWITRCPSLHLDLFISQEMLPDLPDDYNDTFDFSFVTADLKNQAVCQNLWILWLRSPAVFSTKSACPRRIISLKKGGMPQMAMKIMGGDDKP